MYSCFASEKIIVRSSDAYNFWMLLDETLDMVHKREIPLLAMACLSMGEIDRAASLYKIPGKK